MNKEIKNQNAEDMNLIDIGHLILRQYLFMVIIFLAATSIAFAYAITRPTTWQSSVSLLIGEKINFFTTTELIENIENIKYKYSNIADISNIKNTQIIQITTKQNSREMAIEKINSVKNNIILNQTKLLEENKLQFIDLLHSANYEKTNKAELLRLLSKASTASPTKQITEVTIAEQPYGGVFLKIFSIGMLLGLMLSLLLAVIKDNLSRRGK